MANVKRLKGKGQQTGKRLFHISPHMQEDDHPGTCMLHLDHWTLFRCSPDTSQEVLQLRQKWSSLWVCQDTLV